MNVLEAKDVEKTYNGKIRALNGVSVSVGRGTVFGLLGPNGAGKTTFVKITATQLLPSGGSITIMGHDVVSEPQMVRREIAVVPQEARPLSLQTPHEHIFTYLAARGFEFSEARKRANKTISDLNLQNYKDTICANLSGGLRQRVLIAMAMSTDAELLVLDEPTIGLDPVARVEVWNLVREYVSRGKTILLTTHYMDEAEFLSDRLAIINKGRVIASGTPQEVRALAGSTHVVIVKSQNEAEFHPFGRTLLAGTSVRVFVNLSEANELSNLCMKKNLDFSVRQVSLEDVFISEVGEEIDSGAA